MTRTLTKIGLMRIDLDAIVALYPHQKHYYDAPNAVGTIQLSNGQMVQVPNDVYVKLLHLLDGEEPQEGVRSE